MLLGVMSDGNCQENNGREVTPIAAKTVAGKDMQKLRKKEIYIEI